MARLIITDAAEIAIHIAAAIGGIRTKKGEPNIRYSDLDRYKVEHLASQNRDFFQVASSSIKTYVTWVSASPLVNAENEGMITSDEPKLKKADFRRLNNEAYAGSDGYIDEVCFAMFSTDDNLRTKLLLTRMLKVKDENFCDIDIPELSRDGINKAFSFPKPISETSPDIRTAEARTLLRANSENIIKRRTGESLDYLELACIGLLEKRRLLTERPVNKYKVEANLNVHSIPCAASLDVEFTRSEAEEIASELSDHVYAKGPAPKGLLTTADILSAGHLLHESSPAEALKTLYAAGFITKPYTKEGMLPARFSVAEVSRITGACRSSGEQIIGEDEIREVLTKLIQDGAETDGAILPLKSIAEKGLKEDARTLYEYITEKTSEAIGANLSERFAFTAGKYTFFTRVRIDEIKDNLRKNEDTPAQFSVKECPGEKKKKRFSGYTAGELFKELETRGIGSPSMYLDAYQSLTARGFIFEERGVLSLTEKGRDVAAAAPVSREYLNFCGLATGAGPDSYVSQKRLMASFEDVLDRAAEEDPPVSAAEEEHPEVEKNALDVMIRRKEQIMEQFPDGIDEDEGEPPRKKPGNATAPKKPEREKRSEPSERNREDKAQRKPAPSGKRIDTVCPRCGGPLYDTENAYTCHGCGFSVPHVYRYETYEFPLSEKDVANLIGRGRTAYKFGNDEDGNPEVALFITLEEDFSLDVTNESTTKCPVCGEPLYIYEWGFDCDECGHTVPFTVYGKKLPPAQLKKLLKGEATDVMDGLRYGDGTVTSGRIKIRDDGKAVIL